MEVLAIVHQRDAGPGVFAEAVAERGHTLSEWVPGESGPPPLDPFGAVLVFGGAMHVDQEPAHPWLGPEKGLLAGLVRERTPVLGVCLGAQLLAEAAGAEPRATAHPEIGWHDVELTQAAADDPLLAPLPARFRAFQWHSYEFPLPPGAAPLARSSACLQAYKLGGPAWGLQFHAEVTAAIVADWAAGHTSDEDGVRTGVDPAAIVHETEREIAAWNEIGRGICGRFLDEAARYPGVT